MGIISHRKVFILAILAFCFLFGTLIVIKGNIIPQIDNPIVSYSTTDIPVIKTDFLYSDILKSKHNFHTDVNNEIKNINPVSVLHNKELKILFNHKPLSYMVVRQLNNGNYKKIFESKEGADETSIITTPLEPGKYVYGISASYSEGVGLYYFSVEVNKELK